jgi:hypothetical protein
MRAMNAFRRFLLRGGMASRAHVLAALVVLLARALLPGAVMLDPVSAAQGGFAVVMCSGHGPMFAGLSGAATAMPDTMPGMDMDHMGGMTHGGMHLSAMPGSPAHDSMTADDGLCPFSAALVLACAGVALAVVLFTLMRATPSWRAMSVRPLVRTSCHVRPLSRAPPLFS